MVRAQRRSGRTPEPRQGINESLVSLEAVFRLRDTDNICVQSNSMQGRYEHMYIGLEISRWDISG
jgi:hypothetical protein